MDEFEGRVALVTGAASGIGLAAAQLFAARGARVSLIDIDAAAGEAAARELRSDGHEALFVAADIADSEAIETAVERTVEHFGGLDCAYNNAGISGSPATACLHPRPGNRTPHGPIRLPAGSTRRAAQAKGLCDQHR